MSAFTLDDLAALVAARAGADADASYTKALLDQGHARVAKKFGEEAIELIVAAVERDAHAIVCESADVLYHLVVLLEASHVSLSDVLAELQRRTKQSGHQEKAARPR